MILENLDDYINYRLRKAEASIDDALVPSDKNMECCCK